VIVNLRQRLPRLEHCRVQGLAPTYVWLDEQGRVGDDGTEAMRAWGGRPLHYVMATLPRDAALKVYGFDPRNGPA
jgi:hypothetical protein